jgi:hypothetical protein
MSARLVVAKLGQEAARELFANILKADYPVGAAVSWVRQKLNVGTVVQHGYDDRIEVTNSSTGRTYWIAGAEIVAAEFAP